MFQGMNPKMVKQAMKKMGVKEEPIEADEVIIKSGNKEIIIKNPQVSKVIMMGQETFQISGDAQEVEVSNEEDVKTIMEQASCSEEEAKKALKEADGDIAKAIMDLQS